VHEAVRGIPWFMSLGDHDSCGNLTAQVELTGLLPWWNMPAQYYSFQRRIPAGGTVQFGASPSSPTFTHGRPHTQSGSRIGTVMAVYGQKISLLVSCHFGVFFLFWLCTFLFGALGFLLPHRCLSCDGQRSDGGGLGRGGDSALLRHLR
jgi:hypothetical protein